MRHIDFIGKRRWAFLASAIVIGAGLLAAATLGLNYGIDFAGGTELVIASRVSLTVGEIRKTVGELNLGDVLIQEYGDSELNEYLIRVEQAAEQLVGAEGAQESEGETIGERVFRSLQQAHPVEDADAASLDLNLAREDAVAGLLETAAGDAAEATRLAGLLVSHRREHGGLFRSWEEVEALEWLPQEAAATLRARSHLGNFVTLRSELVGPTIGRELRSRAVQAILWSLLGILIYIRVRFREWRFSVAAVACLTHDVLVTVGVLAMVRQEFNLPLIAALLTVVGYSLNDTIVVFDRVRENLRAMRRDDQVTVFNTSINQTLSRTLLTSLTTLLVVACLLILGGPVLRGFSVALFVGVITGTYSTIFIASPLAIFWHKVAAERREAKAG